MRERLNDMCQVKGGIEDSRDTVSRVLGFLERYDEVAQFIAADKVAPGEIRSANNVQAVKGEQASKQDVCLLNSNIGAGTAMMSVAEAH